MATAVEEIRRNVGTQFCPTVFAQLEALVQSDPDVLATTDVVPLAGAA